MSVVVEVFGAVKVNMCDILSIWCPFNSNKTKFEHVLKQITQQLTREKLEKINSLLKFDNSDYINHLDFSIKDTRIDSETVLHNFFKAGEQFKD